MILYVEHVEKVWKFDCITLCLVFDRVPKRFWKQCIFQVSNLSLQISALFRSKSLLELWATTFLADQQLPLIFV